MKKKRENKKLNNNQKWFFVFFAVMILGFSVYASTIISDTNSFFGGNLDMKDNNITNVDSISADRINEVLYVQAGNGSDIQATIDKCSSDGCIVKIPKGRYNISSTILLPSNITLKGWGYSTLIYLDDASNVNVINNSDKTTGNSYITILNLRIDGNGATQADTNLNHGIALKKVKGIIIENVIIDNTEGDGISFEGINAGDNTDIIISESFFNNNRVAIRTKYVERYSISDNQILSGDYGIFVHTYSSYGSVYGNNVKGGTNICIAVESEGHRNVVDSNTVKDCGGRGINLESGSGAEGNIISNNIVINSSSQGIRIYGNKNVVIGNSIQNISTSVGIDSAGSNNLIKGNIILYTGLEGIRIRADNNFVIGNYIYGTGLQTSGTYDGISINADNTRYNIISDNFISHFNSSYLKYGLGISGDDNQTENQFVNNHIFNYSTGAYNEGTNNTIIDFNTFDDAFFSKGIDIGVQRSVSADDLFIENVDGNIALNIEQEGVLSTLRYALKIRSTAIQINSPLVFFEQQNSDTTEGVLRLIQEGSGDALYIDVNGNATGLKIINSGTQHGISIQGTTSRSASRYLLLLNDDSIDNTKQAMLLDLEGNAIGIDIDSEATTAQGIRIQDIPSNKSITIETNDKICLNGLTCSAYISYNGTCIISSNGGCI